MGIEEGWNRTVLLQLVKKRKLSYYCSVPVLCENRSAETTVAEGGRSPVAGLWDHVLRKEGNCTEKEIMQGATSGQRRRGRTRTRWQDNITKWTGLTGDRLRICVEDRSQWRKIIHEAANPRIEDG